MDISFKKYLELKEAAYHGNLGFQEMVMFYRKANAQQEAEMEKIIKAEDWAGYKKLVKKVLGIDLI